MARTCTVCRHPDRQAIDLELLSGVPYRDIAGRRHLAAASLHRHRTDQHIPAKLVLAQAAQVATEADRLLAELGSLKNRALALLDQAEKAQDLRAAASLIAQARSTIETLLEVRGELDRRPQINVSITQSPEWGGLLAVILDSLDRHPAARLELTSALAALEGGESP